MAIETVTHISDLVVTNPTSADPKSQGDDHLRNIKSALKTDLPNVAGVVTASHTELSFVTGVTSAIQTQINAKAPLSSPALTGTPTAPTAAPGSSGTQIATLEYANALALSAALPAQTGNGGKFIKTDGSTASWQLPIADQTGNAGKILQTDGATTSWQKGPALIYLSTVTAAAAATVDIETGFSATYDDYLIVASGVRTSVGIVNINATMKIGGSYITAGYDGVFVYDISAALARTAVAATNAANATVGMGASSTGNGVTGFTLNVFDANSAIAKSGKGSGVCNSVATSAAYTFDSSIGCRTAGVLSGVRLTANSGTITGNFRLYGIVKS